ncbi:MAG: helix-turn-helix domain-containing protein, partial [Myxococcota bacterium]
PGLVVSPADAELTDRVHRLLELLDDPTARQVLEGSRLRELCFALLRSGAGPALHRTFGASRELGRALAFLHQHIAESLTVESLARVAGMSKAVFHRRFRAMTSLSPIQFIKAIRLNHAAALIVGGTTIAQSALQVGYSSPSQFSRDFSRQFGMSPRVWSTKHRGLKTTL